MAKKISEAIGVKQPVKKKEIVSVVEKLNALKIFKEKKGISDVKQKEEEWLVLSPAFQEATRLPGIPCGTVSAIRGHSNTGKSTLKLEVIKAAIKQGKLPVVFELENSFNWERAREMGIEVNEYNDEETGEICLGPSDNMIFYDTSTLYQQYGLYDHENSKYLIKANRDTYVIEDVALCIRELIRAQRDGDLPFDLVFVVDSIGVGDSYKSAVKSGSNNMWYAGALSTSFNTIVNDLIPSSRNVTSEYTNTLFYVNKIWIQQSMTGIPSAKSKGGTSFTYATRLVIYIGGIESASIKHLKATSGGREYVYGTETKIKIEKNHINGITYDGKICSVAQGLWSPDKLDEYKKEYSAFIKSKLSNMEGGKINDDDIEFVTVDVIDE